MQTTFHSDALQAEQLDDMGWACSVLAGQGDPEDCADVAASMLRTLAIHGTTDHVRQAAAGALGARALALM